MRPLLRGSPGFAGSAPVRKRSLELDLIAIGIDHNKRPLPPTALARPPTRRDAALAQARVRFIEVFHGELDVKAGLAPTKQPEPPVADPKEGELTWPMMRELDTR